MNRRAFLGSLIAVSVYPPVQPAQVEPAWLPLPEVPTAVWDHLKRLQAEIDARTGVDPILLKARQIGITTWGYDRIHCHRVACK